MRKYIRPEIALSRFGIEDIITASGGMIVPTEASGYQPSENAEGFKAATYVVEWTSQE